MVSDGALKEGDTLLYYYVSVAARRVDGTVTTEKFEKIKKLVELVDSEYSAKDIHGHTKK